MGYYINPESGSKEDWLLDNGNQVSRQTIQAFSFTTDELPVCLVDNGWMTAAGIAYDANERDRFMEAHLPPDEQRPKAWFLVSKEKLKPFYKE